VKILWVSFAPSDTLGLSSLVDLMNHSDVESVATESTILGPFYVPDSPMREFGESMVETPLAGALLDVWQNAATGFYAGAAARCSRAGRHPWRAAHIHVKVSADGYTPITTHVFDRASDYLDSDACDHGEHSPLTVPLARST
jgi:catechol 1,2-dioxygenase